MNKIYKYILLVWVFCFSAQAQEVKLEDVIEIVNPSVVSIVAENSEEQALGAGIVISTDGYIVTNAHVTENAQKITITTVEDDAYEAKLIGTDKKTDIALLKTKQPITAKPAYFADSESVRVGNTVFAIGNPFGLGNSVSAGIISAKERDIERGPYDNFIQTDAAINQGNSGGPLFNMRGQIIGMNTAIFSTSGIDAGVGFAVPSNIVKWVAEQLRQNGKVIRGWLGIGVQKIRSDDIKQKNKLVVASMSEDSPAAKAGIKVGDILEKVGALSLKTPRHFSLDVAQTAPQTVLPAEVIRDGEKIVLQIKATEAPLVTKDTEIPIVSTDSEIAEMEKVDLSELGLTVVFNEKKQEFVIIEVAKNSEAESKGISVGDKFSTVNNRKVFGVEDLRILIKESEAIGTVVIQFVGEDTVDSITLKLDSTNDQN